MTRVVPDLAINIGWYKVLTGGGLRVIDRWQHGPMGMGLAVTGKQKRGSIIVSQAAYDGVEWLHASIAWGDRMPGYEDLQLLHRSFFGRRRYSYQVFAPESEHVSGLNDPDGLPGHEYALHLWGRVDGKPSMPEFGSYFGRV